MATQVYTLSVGVLKALNTFDKFYNFPRKKKVHLFFQKLTSIVGARTRKLFLSINISRPFVFARFKSSDKLPESEQYNDTEEKERN